jgi:hypothetical protein
LRRVLRLFSFRPSALLLAIRFCYASTSQRLVSGAMDARAERTATIIPSVGLSRKHVHEMRESKTCAIARGPRWGLAIRMHQS